MFITVPRYKSGIMNGGTAKPAESFWKGKILCLLQEDLSRLLRIFADAGKGCTGQVLTSAAALAAFGIVGALLGGAGVIRGGLRVLLGGLAAMAITYGFGRAFNRGATAIP